MLLDGTVTNDLQSDTQLARVQHHQCHCNSTGWAVAHTHPQAEHWAETNLTSRGYLVYLPRHIVRIRDRATPSMLSLAERPLFRGYLFVLHDRAASWRPIYETPGVHSLIRQGNQLQYARNGDIQALQAGDELRRHLPAPNAQWAPGVPCSLAAGLPLSGLPAVVTEVRGRQVAIAVMFLGQLRRVTVHASQLVPRTADA